MTRALVALALGVSAAGAAEPFSHRLHLGLDLECVDCHTKAPASARKDDNLLPAKTVCAPCHESVTIGPPRPTTLSRFNHQLHLKLGNIAPVIAAAIDKGLYLSPPGDLRGRLNVSNPCEACHRGMRVSNATTRAALPQMADCLVCHGKIEPPFSCEYCHAPGPHLKPASHTADWLDRHSSGKAGLDKPSCAVCHGRNFRCQGCH